MRRFFSRQNVSTQNRQQDPILLEPALAEWLNSPLGEALLSAERARLAPIISRVFGYHVLQLSCAPEIDMMADCPVCHQIRFAPAWNQGRTIPVADIESLPLATDSMDAVLLHHSLDYTQDSHRLLREATRVLRPGGRLIIVGFNPSSLWGLSKIVRWRRQMPWNARFISRRRLTDWLSLLDFHVESVGYGGFLPPVRHPRLLDIAPDFERWLDRLGNPTGAFYLIVASKHRIPLIPVVPRWKRMRAPSIGLPLAETGRVARGSGTVIPMRPRRDPLNSQGFSNKDSEG
jgi:SAM-dependent methyltransferase